MVHQLTNGRERVRVFTNNAGVHPRITLSISVPHIKQCILSFF
jgi:hypothetical protein